MKMQDKEYQAYVKKTAPKTSEIKTLVTAFIVGGIICMIGQVFSDVYAKFLKDMDKTEIACLTSMTMIFLGALFTGLGLYDRLGKYAGAGSIIPITGFANSIVSPAMEFKREGIVFGVMAKMFVIAGPVIVSGIVSSVVVGIIYYILRMCGVTI